MDNDLISRSALMEKAGWVNLYEQNKSANVVLVKDICDAHAVDAVPVVRCEDCKHGRPINKQKSQERYYRDDCVVCECENVVGNKLMVYKRMHFCSYGERKNSDD